MEENNKSMQHSLNDLTSTNPTTYNKELRKILDVIVEGKLDGEFSNEKKLDLTNFNNLTSAERMDPINKHMQLEYTNAEMNFNDQPYGNTLTRVVVGDNGYDALTVLRDGDNLYVANGKGEDFYSSRANSVYNAYMEKHKDTADLDSRKLTPSKSSVTDIFVNHGISWNEVEDGIVNKFLDEDKGIFNEG
jgi:hypothetical protein